ncbi:MAG: hypothetical protein WA208_20765 [Thermoanaerobaculia bacterium]
MSEKAHTVAAEAWDEVGALAQEIAARHRATADDALIPGPSALNGVAVCSRASIALMLTAGLAEGEEGGHDA